MAIVQNVPVTYVKTDYVPNVISTARSVNTISGFNQQSLMGFFTGVNALAPSYNAQTAKRQRRYPDQVLAESPQTVPSNALGPNTGQIYSRGITLFSVSPAVSTTVLPSCGKLNFGTV